MESVLGGETYLVVLSWWVLKVWLG